MVNQTASLQSKCLVSPNQSRNDLWGTVFQNLFFFYLCLSTAGIPYVILSLHQLKHTLSCRRDCTSKLSKYA